MLKYITPEQTFAASWTLKSPLSATVAADEIDEEGNNLGSGDGVEDGDVASQ